jgi:hypothetical protein
MVDLLQIVDRPVFVQHSSNSLNAVVKDVLLSVASSPFSFLQVSLIQFEQLGLHFLDFSS